MWTRTWWVRPVSSRHSTSAASRSGVIRRQWVMARLPWPSPVTAIFLRLADERARGASIVPLGGQRHARRRSPDSGGRCCAWRTAAPALRGRRRSWRPPAAPTCPCRCGGRCRAGRRRRCPTGCPPQWWSKALTSVPSRLPAAGWTTSPAGLSMTSRCSSSKTMTERDVLRLVMRRLGLGDGQREGFAAARPWPPDRARPCRWRSARRF